ncbi:MAG: hypothetical protein CL610_00750 [Anaerolineaceae bacterium]|nr:hypothetical protein [Anaerolineaceae bacterium]
MTPRSIRSWLRPWSVTLIVSIVYLGVILAAHGGDPRIWSTTSADYQSCDDPGYDPGNTPGGGYIDGQITYFIARDLGAAADCADVPAYRIQRILLPIAARLLALGSPALIPWTLVLINLTALVGATALLEDLLVQQHVSRWYALVYGLAAGNLLGLRLSTTEPLAFGLIVAAVWFGQRQRIGLLSLMLVLAAFAKEQTLVFAAGYVLHALWHRRWTDAVHIGLIVGVPFALWQLALYQWLGAFGVGSGGEAASGFEWIPFGGYLRIYTASGSLAVFLVMSLLIFPAAVLPTLVGLWRIMRDFVRRNLHPYSWLLLFNAAMMVTLPFTTYREPLGLLRVMMGLILSYLLYAALRFRHTRALRYTFLWLVLNYYLLAG